MYVHAAQVARTQPVYFDANPWNEIPQTQQQIRLVGAHSNIFSEGDDAEFVYEILDGVVACYRLLSDGRRQVISFCFPGDLIGLVQDDQHRYSTETLSPARIRRIPRSILMRAACERPDLGRKLLQFATTELAAMQEHFVMLGRKSALEKVASFLLALARRHGGETALSATFDLPMTRADIADYLGLTLETVSRSLTKLRMAGVIGLPQPQTVVVLGLDHLEDFAEREDEQF